MPIFEHTAAWVRLARTPALDAATLARGLERLHSPRGLISATDADLAAAGIGGAAREYLRAGPCAASAAELSWLEHASHHLVPCTAAEYPGMLRSYENRPLALYVAGRLEALQDPPLAVVGSRQPTPGGAETAFEFSLALARRGLVISSGLAAGIDVAAHRGLLVPELPAITHEKLDAMTLSIHFDITKARRLLGFEPRVGYEEGVMRAVRGEWPALARLGAGS